MESLSLIVGIGIVAFGILYFSFQWDKKEHIFLRILGSFVFISLLFLIPKATFDYKAPCDFVVNETKTEHNITTYDYDYFCVTGHDNTTVSTFYKAYTTFSIIFVTYFFIYLIYTFFVKPNGLIDKLMKRVRKK